MNGEAVTYAEFDLGVCGLQYGVWPCQAALGVTGDHKCFNTRKTCQDPLHYDVDNTGTDDFVTTLVNNTPAGATVSWTGTAIDPDGSVALTVSSRRGAGDGAISSATVNGQPAQIVVQEVAADGTRSAILFAEGPFGSSVDVSITFAATCDWVKAGVWRLKNAVPVDTATSTATPSPSVSVDAPDNSIVLAAVTSWLQSSTSWTGAAEKADASQSSGHYSFAGRAFSDDGSLGHNVTAAQDFVTTAPTVVGTGTGFSVGGGYAIGDIVILAAESQGTWDTSNIDDEFGVDWAQVGSTITDGSAGDLRIFWARLIDSDFLMSTSGFSGNHLSATWIIIRGAAASGDPVAAVATGVSAGAVTGITIPSVTTTLSNSMIVDVAAWTEDNAGPRYSGWTNANLTSMTERTDSGTNSGNGGGTSINTGLLAAIGATGTTTTTCAASNQQLYAKLAISPSIGASRAALVVAVFELGTQLRNTKATVRFGMDVGHQSKEIDSINCLVGYSHTPTVVSLGENLGTRESLSLSFADVPHPDIGPGFDPYWEEREYDPIEQGTLFGKLVARQPYMRGIVVRWYEGYSDQLLSEMVMRTLILDSINGPDNNFNVTVIAKDPLKLADSDKAVAPRPRDGYLLNDITNSATSAVLSPSGIGNAQYPTSGLGTIAGNELATYTRSGDTLTITRGVEGTPASAHSAQDRFQVALVYSAQDAADIIYDLLVTYAEIDPAWIDLADWQAETDAFLRRVYSTIIGEPTSVRKLLVELIVSCGLAMWWDSSAAKIRLIVLREVPSDATILDSSVYMDSPSLRDQADKRTSQMVVHFAIKDPLKGLTDPNNFQQSVRVISAASELNYETSALRNVFSRWIAAFSRTTAERVGDINVGRFADAPKRVSFPVFRNAQVIPTTGGAYRLQARNLQQPNGDVETLPIQVTSVRVERDRYMVEGEEMRFVTNEQDLTNRVITIDGTSYNLNLRSIHDDIYPELADGDTITFIFNETAKVGSLGETLPAVDVGSWPAGFVPHLDVRGKIQGCGGTGGKGANEGGDAGSGGKNGAKGGTALYVRTAITITSPGNIWAGGGGGAAAGCGNYDDHRGGGGGGGAGLRGGTGGIGPGNGEDGLPGNETAGGAGGRSYTANTVWSGPSLSNTVKAGAGGAPGQPGINDTGTPTLSGGSPGAAGNAIDGVSYVTNIGATGSRLGLQVN